MTDRTAFYRILLLCGIMAPAVLVVSVLIAASLTPGYSHVIDTVSQLAAQGRSQPEVVIAGFIIYALLIMAFAWAIYRQMRREIHMTVFSLLLALHGAGFILLALFRDDLELPDRVVTTQGTLHDLSSGAAFIALVAAMFVLAKFVYRSPQWTTFFRFTIVIVIINCILPVLFWIEPAFPIKGLLQRSFYTMSLLWLAILSLYLFRYSNKSRSGLHSAPMD